MRRHEGGDVAAEAGDFFDDAGAEERVGVFRHHENRFHFFVQLAVHERELEFEFEVGDGAQTADDGLGFALVGVVNEQAVEGINFGVGDVFDAAADEFDAFFEREERLFAFVFGDRHDDMVEQFDGAFDDVEVAVRQGIKTAGINGGSHVESLVSPQSSVHSLQFSVFSLGLICICFGGTTVGNGLLFYEKGS